jgi:hypothetical protein
MGLFHPLFHAGLPRRFRPLPDGLNGRALWRHHLISLIHTKPDPYYVVSIMEYPSEGCAGRRTSIGKPFLKSIDCPACTCYSDGKFRV